MRASIVIGLSSCDGIETCNRPGRRQRGAAEDNGDQPPFEAHFRRLGKPRVYPNVWFRTANVADRPHGQINSTPESTNPKKSKLCHTPAATLGLASSRKGSVGHPPPPPDTQRHRPSRCRRAAMLARVPRRATARQGNSKLGQARVARGLVTRSLFPLPLGGPPRRLRSRRAPGEATPVRWSREGRAPSPTQRPRRCGRGRAARGGPVTRAGALRAPSTARGG